MVLLPCAEPLRTVTRKDVMKMGLDEQKRFLAALKQTMVNPDGVRPLF